MSFVEEHPTFQAIGDWEKADEDPSQTARAHSYTIIKDFFDAISDTSKFRDNSDNSLVAFADITCRPETCYWLDDDFFTLHFPPPRITLQNQSIRLGVEIRILDDGGMRLGFFDPNNPHAWWPKQMQGTLFASGDVKTSDPNESVVRNQMTKSSTFLAYMINEARVVNLRRKSRKLSQGIKPLQRKITTTPESSPLAPSNGHVDGR